MGAPVITRESSAVVAENDAGSPNPEAPAMSKRQKSRARAKAKREKHSEHERAEPTREHNDERDLEGAYDLTCIQEGVYDLITRKKGAGDDGTFDKFLTSISKKLSMSEEDMQFRQVCERTES